MKKNKKSEKSTRPNKSKSYTDKSQPSHQRNNNDRSRSNATSYQGVLEITRSGMGFVVVADLERDIMIRPSDLSNALNGDEVHVLVTKEAAGNGRLQGKITGVAKRKQTDFTGTLQLKKNYGFFVPDGDQSLPDMFIAPEHLRGAQDGDRIIVKLLNWEKNKKPEASVEEVLPAGDHNDAAMKEILLEQSFPLKFSEGALKEAEQLSGEITKAELKRRKDFREVFTITIDPVDAKDFDDAISYKTTKSGFEIGVHIADVSHFVQPNSLLDEEAYERATSVYLPDRVNPMLPENISNVLCSLRPHEDKYAFSAVFEFNKKGEIKKKWIGRTIIHSNHRFTYEEVQEIIETGEGPYAKEILHLNQLAQSFRKERFQLGAINFSSTEVRFKLDEKGAPIGIVVKESKEAHQLVEEFMLLSNKTVAAFVAEKNIQGKPVPFPYRVHDQPDEEKLKPFMEFALKYGHRFDLQSPQSIASSFNNMLLAVKGKPEQHVLEQLGIRTMAKAVYTKENIGHYGLGFDNYCHFTSPIRRYPDVLVHRILQDLLDGTAQPDSKMEEKCKHCSERERAAMDAERSANKYKQVEYMQNFLGEEFEGVISGVSAFGFWAETVEHKCEGMVSIASLAAFDDFRLIESDFSLVGRRSGRKFRMGDKLTVKVVAANLTKRQIDYEWVISSSLHQMKEAGVAPTEKSSGHKKKDRLPATEKDSASQQKKKASKGKSKK